MGVKMIMSKNYSIFLLIIKHPSNVNVYSKSKLQTDNTPQEDKNSEEVSIMFNSIEIWSKNWRGEISKTKFIW